MQRLSRRQHDARTAIIAQLHACIVTYIYIYILRKQAKKKNNVNFALILTTNNQISETNMNISQQISKPHQVCKIFVSMQ